jgi:hypothetical protein
MASVLPSPTVSDQEVTNYADTATGTTATLKFTSSEAGTYYILVSSAATNAPKTSTTLAEIYSATGAAALGQNTVALTGMTPDTAYKAHLTVKNVEGGYSTVWSSEAFTPTISAPDTEDPPPETGNIPPELSLQEVVAYANTPTGTTATIRFASSKAEGTYWVVVCPSDSPAPAEGTVLEAMYNLLTIRATGAAALYNIVEITGLTPGTAYKAHLAAKDAEGSYSAVWSSETFTPTSSTLGSDPAPEPTDFPPEIYDSAVDTYANTPDGTSATVHFT